MPNICPFPQHAGLVAEAMAVTLSPSTATPQQRLFAWAALKSARGQTMHQFRLARMPVQTGDACPALIGGAA